MPEAGIASLNITQAFTKSIWIFNFESAKAHDHGVSLIFYVDQTRRHKYERCQQ